MDVRYTIFEDQCFIDTRPRIGSNDVVMLGILDDTVTAKNADTLKHIPFTIVPYTWGKTSEVGYNGKVFKGEILENTDKRVKLSTADGIIHTYYDYIKMDHSHRHNPRRIILDTASIGKNVVVSAVGTWLKWNPVLNVNISLDGAEHSSHICAQIESQYDNTIEGDVTLISRQKAVTSSHHRYGRSTLESARPMALMSATPPSSEETDDDQVSYSMKIEIGPISLGSITNYPIESFSGQCLLLHMINLSRSSSAGKAVITPSLRYTKQDQLPPSRCNITMGDIRDSYNIRSYMYGEAMFLPLTTSDTIRYESDVEEIIEESKTNVPLASPTKTYKISLKIIKTRQERSIVCVSFPGIRHLISTLQQIDDSLSEPNNPKWIIDTDASQLGEYVWSNTVITR